MSALDFYNSARAYKRELIGNPTIGLTDDDMAALLAATDDRWKPTKATFQLSRPDLFFAHVRAAHGKLTEEQVSGFNALLDAMGAARWPLAWTAYGLATAWHETAQTMQPIKEYGGPTYFKKMYDIQGQRPDVARRLGNTVPGDGVQFAGRGYVQLTGRSNYLKAAEYLEVPLIGNPDLAMDCEIAAKIMLWGMEFGIFTGKSLKDYLPISGRAGHEAYKAARRIINGTDKAAEIAKLALGFEAALVAGGWQ